MNLSRLLAEQYQGKVRFAYVDVTKSFNLKESFMVHKVPKGFLYLNGTFYELELGTI